MSNTKVLLAALLTVFPASLPAQQPAPAEEGAAVTLGQLIQEALENNPAVQAAARRVEAMRHRIAPARSLPDPRVTAGWNGDPAPFDTVRGFPPSSRNFGATQTIPFPGKLQLRGEIANREAEAARWDYEAVRRRVAAEVKTAYYEYFYAGRALQITGENKQLLEKLAEIAEVRYRVGKGIQQDAVKAQLELSKILRQLTVLEQMKQTARVRINTLLRRDPEAPLTPPRDLEPPEFTYSLGTLYQLARENDTGLAREAQLIERSQVAVNLAQKEYYPDFSLSYMYQNRPLLPDTQGVTVGISIPVFYRSRQREAELEASENLIAARRTREARETTLQFEVKQHFLTARAAEELMQLYSQAITPQSSLALESSLSAYQVGRVEFLTVLDNFRSVLDAEINYYRELANFQTALARLEPLVGVELTN